MKIFENRKHTDYFPLLNMSFFLTEPWFLVMERAAHGDLLSYLQTAQKAGITLPHNELSHIAEGIVDGLGHLHKQHVCKKKSNFIDTF